MLSRKQTKHSEPINVLIVEDSQLAALGLTTQLEQFICTYEIVNNGKQAIQRAQETNFTIILLDMGLPDINGIEVTKEIRSNRDPKKANIPIIAVTGHGDSSKHRKACHDVGINKVLVKPTKTVGIVYIPDNTVERYEGPFMTNVGEFTYSNTDPLVSVRKDQNYFIVYYIIFYCRVILFSCFNFFNCFR